MGPTKWEAHQIIREALTLSDRGSPTTRVEGRQVADAQATRKRHLSWEYVQLPSPIRHACAPGPRPVAHGCSSRLVARGIAPRLLEFGGFSSKIGAPGVKVPNDLMYVLLSVVFVTGMTCCQGLQRQTWEVQTCRWSS